MLIGFKRAVVTAAITASCVLPTASPALAWRTGVVVGVAVPAPVFAVPRVVVAPPVVVPPVVIVPGAYRPPPPHWVPGHYSWRGFWIPGHWV